MSQALRGAVFERRHELATIKGVCATGLVVTPVSDPPLGEAIAFVADGMEGHLTSGATVFF